MYILIFLTDSDRSCLFITLRGQLPQHDSLFKRVFLVFINHYYYLVVTLSLLFINCRLSVEIECAFAQKWPAEVQQWGFEITKRNMEELYVYLSYFLSFPLFFIKYGFELNYHVTAGAV